MKQIRKIFEKKEFLLDEPEVEQLITYCEELQDSLIEFKYEKDNNKQLIMLDMLKEIVKACTEVEKQQREFTRFGLEPPDLEAGISNLKRYIVESCKDNKIYL